MRYSPCGSVRFSDGVSLTDFTYTGQLSISYIKLIKMGVRWYDPALGRFTQPDSIIPATSNPLAFDRYMFAFSNPLKFVDPTGNIPESDTDELNEINDLLDELKLYGIDIDGIYSIEELKAILNAAKLAGKKHSEYVDGNYIEVFRLMHGDVEIKVGVGLGPSAGNCETDGGIISCHKAPDLQNTLHEFGHVFDNHYEEIVKNFASGDIPWEWELTQEGYMCDGIPCMVHSEKDFPGTHNLSEEFADMYMNWVLHGVAGFPDNGFDLTTDLGEQRLRYMNGDPWWPNGGMEYWLTRLGFEVNR
jgi:RHS repeat-associated protein